MSCVGWTEFFQSTETVPTTAFHPSFRIAHSDRTYIRKNQHSQKSERTREKQNMISLDFMDELMSSWMTYRKREIQPWEIVQQEYKLNINVGNIETKVRSRYF